MEEMYVHNFGGVGGGDPVWFPSGMPNGIA
jgi:hypothetical protein